MKSSTYSALLLMLLLSGCDRKVNETDFTKLYSERMKELDPGVVINELGTLQIDYRLPGTEEATESQKAFLDNAYRTYINGEDLDEVIDRYARATVNVRTETDVDIDRIVAVIKDRDYIREANESLRSRGVVSDGLAVFSVPFGDAFSILYAEDTEEGIRYINSDEFQKLSMDETTLREKAISNLRRILPKIELVELRIPGLFMVTAGGTYESSVLLFNDVWIDLQSKVDGNIVIAVPSRDVLLVTGTNNKEGIAMMREGVKKISADASYLLTDRLSEYKNGSWVAYQ